MSGTDTDLIGAGGLFDADLTVRYHQHVGAAVLSDNDKTRVLVKRESRVFLAVYRHHGDRSSVLGQPQDEKGGEKAHGQEDTKQDQVSLLKQGFQRVKIDGEVFDLEDVPNLEKNIKHDIEVVVDRLIIKDEDMSERVAQSVETALKIISWT